MFKFWAKKDESNPLKPVKTRVDDISQGPFTEAGKPGDGKTPHQSPRPPRNEGSEEGAQPEHKPA